MEGKMTFEAFAKHAEGVTGTGEDSDMLFYSYVTGPQGSRYELFKEKRHSSEDLVKAQKYLRRNFDVVKIYIYEEK